MEKHTSNLDHFQEFCSWIRNDPKNVINASPKEFKGMGYGLIADQALESNDIILAINEKYFISVDVAFEDIYFQKCLIESQKTLGNRQILASYIWYQISLKEKSPWYLYLLTLPKTFSNPCLWDINQINKLIRAKYIDHFLNKMKTLEQEYNELKGLLVILNLKMTYTDYYWLISLIESRSISCPTKHDPKYEVGVLIPYFDFANHEFLYDQGKVDKPISYEDYYYYNNETKQFILKGCRNHIINEQIFIMYATKPTLHFLEYYGFIPRYNPFNSIQFTLLTNSECLYKMIGFQMKQNCYNAMLGIIGILIPVLVIKTKGELKTQKNKRNMSVKQNLSESNVKLQNLTLIPEINFEIDNNGNFNWMLCIFLKILSLSEMDLNTITKSKYHDLLDETYFHSTLHQQIYQKMSLKLINYLINEINSIEILNSSIIIKDDHSGMLAKELLLQEIEILKKAKVKLDML